MSGICRIAVGQRASADPVGLVPGDPEHAQQVFGDPIGGLGVVAVGLVVQQLSEDHQLYLMDRKGTSIREHTFAGNPCFLLTDHIPMPKKTVHGLERLGATKIALGSKMLFAGSTSSCENSYDPFFQPKSL